MKSTIAEKYKKLKKSILDNLTKDTIKTEIPSVLVDERGIVFLKEKTIPFPEEYHEKSMERIMETEFSNIVFTDEEKELAGDLHPKQIYFLLKQRAVVFCNSSFISRNEYQNNPTAIYHGIGRLFIGDSLEKLTNYQVKELLHYMEAFHCFRLFDIFIIDKNKKTKYNSVQTISLDHLEAELKNISYDRMKVSMDNKTR